ncbi:MAG: beta-ketoacyl-ACP synthase III [Desulfitobacteriia bacterium]|jgi:3-oxoacyl-[acyl-carrier-protein] synthase-3
MYNVEIVGTGSFVPEHIVTNHDLTALVETSDEWIRQMTGIEERRISLAEDTADMGALAAKRALENCGSHPEEIELIIVATVTSTYLFPSTACQIQTMLGASKATAFDISAGCAGFIYGLSIARQYIKSGLFETALVIGAEVLSKITDWEDRSTCVLFADGAGAAVLKRGEVGIVSEFTGADGRGGKNLNCLSRTLKNCFLPAEDNGPYYTTMDGKEVFKFALKVVPECIQRVLEGTGYALEEVKYFIPHQANVRIVEAVAKKLSIENEKFIINMHKYGNTSSASIPIALDEMSREGLLLPGDLVCIAGFGAGYTYGAHLIKWTKNA